MKGLIISSTLPSISGNIEEIKLELTEQLKQFDLIVDEDSVKTAKSMATYINKLSKEINEKRKQIVKELSAPIKEFEVKMEELKSLCQDSRQNLLSQVKVYDDKRLDEVQILLSKELQNRYTHYGVKEEFQTVKIDGLVILSHLTQGGALAKKARDTIDERVSKVKKFQEKIDTRLLTLESICFKGGLTAPLTRENINHFLMVESDDEYLSKLVSLIDNELERKASELRRDKAGQDAAAQAATNYVPPAEQAKPQQYQPPSKPQGTVTKRIMKNVKEFAPQKKKLTVTATFEIEVDTNIDEYAIKQLMLRRFKESGNFKMIPDISVEKSRKCSTFQNIAHNELINPMRERHTSHSQEGMYVNDSF